MPTDEPCTRTWQMPSQSSRWRSVGIQVLRVGMECLRFRSLVSISLTLIRHNGDGVRTPRRGDNHEVHAAIDR